MKDLEGKLALVTGGASGIGQGMARAFAGAGMRVIVADIEFDAAQAVARELSSRSPGASALQLDVADRAAWSEATQRIRSDHGAVHVICNNAGISYSRFAMSDLVPAAWDRILQVNVTGVFNGVQAFVNGLYDAGQGGHIVNTASILGFLSAPDLGAYITSKFAVLGMSEVLRHELAPKGIGVSILCPGFVATRIAENSMKYADASTDAAAFAAERRAAAEKFKSAMDPALVGRRVLEAVRQDEFFVFTHPEYRTVVANRFEAILAAFGPSAAAGYADDVSVLGGQWLRQPPE